MLKCQICSQKAISEQDNDMFKGNIYRDLEAGGRVARGRPGESLNRAGPEAHAGHGSGQDQPANF